MNVIPMTFNITNENRKKLEWLAEYHTHRLNFGKITLTDILNMAIHESYEYWFKEQLEEDQ